MKTLFISICCVACLLLDAIASGISINTNSIVLNIADGIDQSERNAILSDFFRCLAPMGDTVILRSSSHHPSDMLSLADLWQPYSSFPVLSDLGPELPDIGTLSNGTFYIDIGYAFATNHVATLLPLQSYSNEISMAFEFIDSLSASNLQAMSSADLIGSFLWKDVPPGGNPIPEGEIQFAERSMRTTRYFTPPLFAFHVWDMGPTNSPPYLWCEIPCLNFRSEPSHSAMIFYQDRWWLTAWPLQPGEQQW